MLGRRVGMTGAHRSVVIEILTSDGGLAILSAVGIMATAVSIVRDARAQKSRLVTEDLSIDLRRVA